MVLPNVSLSVFFVNNWGMNTAAAPVIFSINAGVVAIFQEKVTFVTRYQNRAKVIFSGVALMVVMLMILAILPNLSNIIYKWLIVSVVGIILAVIDMLYMPATNALIAKILDPSLRGKSVGLFQTSMAVEMAIYPSSVGLLEYSPELLWILTSTSVLLGRLCYWFAVQNTSNDVKFAEFK